MALGGGQTVQRSPISGAVAAPQGGQGGGTPPFDLQGLMEAVQRMITGALGQNMGGFGGLGGAARGMKSGLGSRLTGGGLGIAPGLLGGSPGGGAAGNFGTMSPQGVSNAQYAQNVWRPSVAPMAPRAVPNSAAYTPAPAQQPAPAPAPLTQLQPVAEPAPTDTLTSPDPQLVQAGQTIEPSPSLVDAGGAIQYDPALLLDPYQTYQNRPGTYAE